jgi:hypothetical protein
MPKSQSSRSTARRTRTLRAAPTTSAPASNRLSIGRLPAFHANPVHSTTARYMFSQSSGASALGTTSFLASDLVALPGVMATGANTVTTICNAVRIRKVSAWLSTANSTTTSAVAGSSIGIVWASNINGTLSLGEAVADTTLSSAFPAFVCSRPAANDLAGYWINSAASTVTVFQINKNQPTNTTATIVVDVEFDYMISNQAFNPTNYTTGNTATVGRIYYIPLDGVSSGSFIRQNLPSIV